jgi:hypothetical protein
VSDFPDDEVRYYGLYPGVVVDRRDPRGIGRVRVRIPGIVERSGWALPKGGGINRRGHFDVPELNADVFVQFLMGDMDRPVYEAGPWGVPDAGREVPERVRDAPVEDAPDIRAYETKEWAIVFDDRTGKDELLLKHKQSGVCLKVTPAMIQLGTEASGEFLALGTTLAEWQNRVLDLIIAHNHGTGVGPSGPPMNAPAFVTEKGRISEHVSDLVKTQKAVP